MALNSTFELENFQTEWCWKRIAKTKTERGWHFWVSAFAVGRLDTKPPPRNHPWRLTGHSKGLGNSVYKPEADSQATVRISYRPMYNRHNHWRNGEWRGESDALGKRNGTSFYAQAFVTSIISFTHQRRSANCIRGVHNACTIHSVV
jgi:hypothetical protein